MGTSGSIDEKTNQYLLTISLQTRSIIYFSLKRPQPGPGHPGRLRRALPGLRAGHARRLRRLRAGHQLSRPNPGLVRHARLLLRCTPARSCSLHLVRDAVLPGRPVPRRHDLGHLAAVRRLPQPPAGIRPRHERGAAVLLPLHTCPAAAAVVARQQPAIHVHGQDAHHACVWADVVHLGPCCG